MAKYVVALSGGADSVCLLLKLLERSEVAVAAHCNFHLRGEESNRDEEFVRTLCRERGVELLVKHFDTRQVSAQSGESIEMVARRLRYEWFAQVAAQYACSGVAVGHHQEDNAETLLLNIARGAGLNGLIGMQRYGNNGGELCIYRPLLSYTKSEILSYLHTKHQTFVTDSTNTDVHYKRNRIRQHIIPEFQQLNPQFVHTVNAMAQRLHSAFNLYKIKVNEIALSCGLSAIEGAPQYQQINIYQLQQAPEPATILHELLSPLGFTSSQVQNILTMKVGGIASSSLGIATRSEKMLIFGPPIPKVSKMPLLMPTTVGQTLTTTLHTKCCIEATLLNRSDVTTLRCASAETLIDASTIKGSLYLRSVATADRFQPFGMKGKSQLLSDYMTNHHLSRIEKSLSLVLTDNNGIVWLVGQRADERVRITEHTHQILRLKQVKK